MVESCEAEEDSHEDNRAGGSVDAEQADEADLRDVHAGHELLDTAPVGGAMGIDVVAEDEE